MRLRKSPLYSLYYSSQESGKVLLELFHAGQDNFLYLFVTSKNENVLKLVNSVWGVSRIIEHIRLIIPIPDDTLLRHPSKWTQWETPPSMSNTRYFVLESLISLQLPT